jgi:predicted MFS family arabinose efflux permease
MNWRRRGLRRLLLVNLLDAFIAGAYTLMIPLLLVERNMNITTIGLVFSVLPLVFVVSRLFFAASADSLGFRKFFNLNAAGNFVSVVLYSLSSSSTSYALARGVQGVKEASLWAVNRNAAYEIAGDQNADVASRIIFVRALPLALGAIASGFLIFWVGFTPVFIILAFLSVLIFVPASMLRIGGKEKESILFEVIKKLDPTSVSKTVWSASIVMCFYFLASSLTIGFVLPIFLRSRGLGYWEIGILLAAYNALGALLLLLTAQKVLTVKNAIIVQALLYLPAALIIPLSEGWLMTAMIVLMAIAEWTSYMTMESVVVNAVRGCENTATAISFLFTPGQLATMVGFVLAGLLVEMYGYTAPFWVAGMFFVTYSASAWLMLKDGDARKGQTAQSI